MVRLHVRKLRAWTRAVKGELACRTPSQPVPMEPLRDDLVRETIAQEERDRLDCARSMAKNIVYFDLETQRSADEVGGWDRISQMGMSVGVLYSTALGEYRIYGEKQVDQLIKDLQRADLVVGFNNLRFDYEVLHGYTALDLRQLPTLDMLVELQATLQHRLSLDSLATGTFGVEKTAEGMQAIQWYKEGRILEIAEYCCYDVKITKLVHEYGVQNHQIHYLNRFGKKLSVPVKW